MDSNNIELDKNFDVETKKNTRNFDLLHIVMVLLNEILLRINFHSDIFLSQLSLNFYSKYFENVDVILNKNCKTNILNMVVSYITLFLDENTQNLEISNQLFIISCEIFTKTIQKNFHEKSIEILELHQYSLSILNQYIIN